MNFLLLLFCHIYPNKNEVLGSSAELLLSLPRSPQPPFLCVTLLFQIMLNIWQNPSTFCFCKGPELFFFSYIASKMCQMIVQTRVVTYWNMKLKLIALVLAEDTVLAKLLHW